MALSGSFTGTTNSTLITPKIVWSGVQSVDGNYTDITATLYYSRTNTGYTTYGTWSGSITINGTKNSGTKYIEITYNSNTIALTAKTRVYHNSDGTKSITISALGAISGTSLSSTTISATVTLTTIPRATTPTFSASSVNMGSAVTINLNRASSGFTHTLSYSFGSLSGQTSGLSASSGVGTSSTFTPPLTLANQIPSATSGTCTVTCKTYSGSILIGTKTATLTLKVPTSVVPTISSVSVTEATTGLAAKFGAFIQNKSTLSVEITASGTYSSTITSYRTTIGSSVYTSDKFTTGIIATANELTMNTVVIDSRGRTATYSKSINVLEYTPPVINGFSAWRITSAGAASDDGTKLAVQMSYAIASLGEKNDMSYSLKWSKDPTKPKELTSFASGDASESYSGTQTFTSSTDPTLSTENAYQVRLEVSDYFQTVAYEVQVPTAFTLMDFNATGKGMAIGKVSEKDAFEIGMSVYLSTLETSAGNILTIDSNGKVNKRAAIYDAPYGSAIMGLWG